MRRYIVLFLITGTIGAQTGLDKLVLKDGTEYHGDYLKHKRKIIYFKRQGIPKVQKIHINIIKSLKLKDDTIIINFGKIMEISSAENIELTTERKAVYDAKKDAQKWLAYPPLALISAAGLSTSTFYIGEGILDPSDETILLQSVFVGLFGLVGSYHLFIKLEKRSILILRQYL